MFSDMKTSSCATSDMPNIRFEKPPSSPKSFVQESKIRARKRVSLHGYFAVSDGDLEHMWIGQLIPL